MVLAQFKSRSDMKKRDRIRNVQRVREASDKPITNLTFEQLEAKRNDERFRGTAKNLDDGRNAKLVGFGREKE